MPTPTHPSPPETPEDQPKWTARWNYATIRRIQTDHDLASIRLVARATEISHRTLSRQLRGDAPEMDAVAAISGKFGVPVCELVTISCRNDPVRTENRPEVREPSPPPATKSPAGVSVEQPELAIRHRGPRQPPMSARDAAPSRTERRAVTVSDHPQGTTPKKYLTADEVAEMTHYTKQSICRFANLYEATKKLRKTRGLKGTRPGGGPWRFHIDDVERFMRGEPPR